MSSHFFVVIDFHRERLKVNDNETADYHTNYQNDTASNSDTISTHSSTGSVSVSTRSSTDSLDSDVVVSEFKLSCGHSLSLASLRQRRKCPVCGKKISKSSLENV